MLIAFAVPILPGKTEQWKAFTKEIMGKWRGDFERVRRELGVRERAFLQSLPTGDVALVTFEGDEKSLPGALARVFRGKDAFTSWFVDRVRDVHGIDLRTFEMPVNTPMIDSGAVGARPGTGVSEPAPMH